MDTWIERMEHQGRRSQWLLFVLGAALSIPLGLLVNVLSK
jgi:hypothetical protein